MTKRLFALLVFFNFSFAYAQTIKTDVLVIGGTPSGVTAAIQCARSKVKTILVEASSRLCPDMKDAGMVTVKADRNIPSGIWGEFLKRIKEHYNKTLDYDTAYNAPLKFDEQTGRAIITNMADTVKNLEIKLNTYFISIKKDEDRWDVSVMENGSTEIIKARVVIDATADGNVIGKAGASPVSLDSLENKPDSKLYRTSIAMGDEWPGKASFKPDYPPLQSYCIPVTAMIAKGAESLLVTEKLMQGNSSAKYLSDQLILGQGAGVIAAYCAFFKTSTNNLKIRAIQTELLDFKGYLLPFEDIGTDPQWRSIQQVCATGMLKGVQKTIEGKNEFIFDPDATVTTAEVKPIILEIYTRAFLWFNKEKPGKDFTIGNLLSFISEITLNDTDILQKNIARNWKTQYKFTSDFDMDRPITRREFAILTNKYLNPFARTVDMGGKIVN
jgi:hypothetical protein